MLLPVTVAQNHYMASRGLRNIPKSEHKAIVAEAKRLGAEIQRHRKLMGYTQEKLAEKLDVSASAIRTIEIGVRMPSIPMLIRISRELRFQIAFVRK